MTGAEQDFCRQRHDVVVEPMDPEQERELAFQRSQSPWVRLSIGRRVGAAALIPLVAALAAGAFAALAGGPWTLVAGIAALASVTVAIPYIVMPERMFRTSVRMTTPTADSMKQGERNRNWPG